MNIYYNRTDGADRFPEVRIPVVIIISALLVSSSGLLSGCSRESAADDAQKTGAATPQRTPEQAADIIRNDSNMSQADKDKYLRQLKENEMAASMNPNVSGPTNIGPTPPASK